MITSLNIENFLIHNGFTESNGVYMHNGLGADMNSRRLIYPDSIRGHDRNTSFNANENFVVFECVYRLMKQGYHPEDIELEKEWHLGHVPKSGRADICVYEHESESVLFIVECKTWGKEFDKAMKDTLNDGAQLFSYWQQESSCKWLVLYSSDLKDDGTTEYKSPAINCSDDTNLIRRSREDEKMSKSIMLYENAESAKKKYEVWHDTYNLEIYDDVIFSEDSSAYDIGVKPLRKRDLKIFLEDGKNRIVNSFEEILRHNNVSDKENAFNRLIALFICKLVDETRKNEDAEVEFQYRHRTDSYEALQDRLQRLYTEGMRDFMHEEITYIPSDYPEKLFSNYNGERRHEAINELKKAFIRLKFFTNNDFAFVDVHNEGLFYQNGKILVEVVQLFSKYRIVHTSKHQVLGDLFEQLLDKGFKQNEGQFFTPMPITRFIWDSLPLKRYKTWPRVIDYACGAGHFLTEAVEALNYYLRPKEERHESEDEKDEKNINAWTRDCIYGIEKDYRLARVSKVSMFMNGAGDSNIIFGDGLENTGPIKPGTFDILTANPPYSIASFMQHLKLSNNDFTLLSSLTANSSEIEVLFVERIAQLLASGGIAAVILPSSILSNDSACYTGARELILQNFMIRSIVQFGNKTFGATGTNTVVMFLERYEYPPERLPLVKDSMNMIIEGRNLKDWEDEYILDAYLSMQGLTHEDWNVFTDGKADPETLHEYFRMYADAFNSRKENQKLKEDRPDEYIIRFYEYAKKNESEKLLYYGMTYKHRTVVILAPSDNAGQKEFLGYDWSSRKGAEGIQYAPVRGGKLYVDANREAEGTLAHVVRQSFGDDDIVMTEDNARYARVVRTCGMIDFSRLNFNKAMRLREQKNFDIESKYPCAKLSTVAKINIPKSEAKKYSDDTLASFIDMSSVSADGRIIRMTDKKIADLWNGSYIFFCEGDIITAKMMSGAETMKCAIAEGLTNGIGFGSSEFYVVRCDEEKLMTRYLYEFLNTKTVREAAWASVTGSGRLRVPSRFYEDIMITLPPMEIQTQIVNECARIDSAHDDAKNRIAKCRERIENIFRELESKPTVMRISFDDKRYFTLMIGRRVLNSELIDGGHIPVFSANVLEPFGYVDNLLKGFDDFTSDSVLWGIDGDFMVSFYARGHEFYPTDHCGVLRVITDRVHPRYMARVLEREGRQAGFSRSYRASLDRVGRLTFDVPDVQLQNEMMNEVLNLESEIAEAMKRIESLSGKKEAILKKYL